MKEGRKRWVLPAGALIVSIGLFEASHYGVIPSPSRLTPDQRVIGCSDIGSPLISPDRTIAVATERCIGIGPGNNVGLVDIVTFLPVENGVPNRGRHYDTQFVGPSDQLIQGAAGSSCEVNASLRNERSYRLQKACDE